MIPISQDQCDPNDPDTHALWALRSLPAPIRPKVSRELWDAGFRWNEELQTVQFQTDPSLKSLGPHAPAQPMPLKRADAKRLLETVDPAMAAEVEAAEKDESTKAKLLRKQRDAIKRLQDELGHTLGDQ